MRVRTLPYPRLRTLALSLAAFCGLAQGASAADPFIGHGFAMHGDMKYGADFKHFSYAKPDAPKGGEVKLSAIGTFDSFNAFILRGVPTGVVALTFDTLMTQAADEAFTEYCNVCETIEVPQDRSWVAFTIRREARFHDGAPMTPEDVIWTFETLKTKGHPRYRSYYGDVAKVEKDGERRVKFTFVNNENRELPLILGQLPVLPRHYWKDRDFEKTTLEPPLGSGAYKIEAFEPGRYVTLKRVPDYWGAKIPVNVGRMNFEIIRYDYYRDATVAFEAFKAGEYDLRQENSAKNWATGYDEIPAVQQGLIKRDAIEDLSERVMQGYYMNTRRDVFKDRRVREAMSYAFDFEWTNKTLFYGLYTRINSYFGRDPELASRGLPQGDELKILEKFRDKLPPEIFTKEFAPPKTDGTGNWRDSQRIASRLLREAGYKIDKERLVDSKGNQLSFEILLDNPQFERITLPYVENLKRLGINAIVRTVDTSQYQRRIDDFDYDMTVQLIAQSSSPGNEQRDFFSTKSADIKGSTNYAGVRDPVVDALVEMIIAAPDRASLTAATRAMDRVLLWGHYAVPQFRLYKDWVASWDKFSRPEINPLVGFNSSLWWVDPKKDAALRERRGQPQQ